MGKVLLIYTLDAHERAEYEELVRDDYEKTIHDLKQQEGITEDDIKDFEKAQIIVKSIEFVKVRAEHQAEIRKGASSNFHHIKSKVARCIKVQKKVAKRSKKIKEGNFNETYGIHLEKDTSFRDSQMQTYNDNSVNISAALGSPQPRTDKLKQINSQLETQKKELAQLQEDIKLKKILEQKQHTILVTDVEQKQAPQTVIVKSQTKQVQQTSFKSRIEDSVTKQSGINANGEKWGSIEIVERRPVSEQRRVPATQKIQSKKIGVQGGFVPSHKVEKKGPQKAQGGFVPANVQEREVKDGGSVQNYTVKKGNIITSSGLPTKIAAPQQQLPSQQLQQQEEPEEDFTQLAEQQKIKHEEVSKFKNPELEHKTTAIQSEFDQLLDEMMNRRQNRDTENFYQVMNEFYGKGPDDEKHVSPTKRLISLKNSTTEQKKVLYGNVDRQEYSLTYCSSPGKSYIIEPHGGELNYANYEKNPEKFYQQVFN